MPPMHRKRKRRRRLNRPSISARLLLDERMKDEVGVLSGDLFADLFPEYKGTSRCVRLPRRVQS
ncbi:MAG: hypothetical protein INR71_00780 [Terriglobus roseus]|nr:hypothetical protein [Terriglobus roseus]